jgi:hypothetical protein
MYVPGVYSSLCSKWKLLCGMSHNELCIKSISGIYVAECIAAVAGDINHILTQ